MTALLDVLPTLRKALIPTLIAESLVLKTFDVPSNNPIETLNGSLPILLVVSAIPILSICWAFDLPPFKQNPRLERTREKMEVIGFTFGIGAIIAFLQSFNALRIGPISLVSIVFLLSAIVASIVFWRVAKESKESTEETSGGHTHEF